MRSASAFPMGGNVDTFLMARKKPDWGSAKSTRRAFIAKDYRVLLNLGDNFGDFSDAYRGTGRGAHQGLRGQQGALGPRVDHAGKPGLRLVRDGVLRPRLQEVAGRTAQGQARGARRVEGPGELKRLVIASEATQSSPQALDCFVGFAASQ